MTSETGIELASYYETFLDEFLAQEIDVKTFSHRDHLGVGFEMLKRFEYLMAVQIYSESISAMASRAGKSGKFNLTITLAMMSIISERMQPGEDFDDFLEANPDLINRDLLERYYTLDRLNSFKAKGMFLMPDKLAFDQDI